MDVSQPSSSSLKWSNCWSGVQCDWDGLPGGLLNVHIRKLLTLLLVSPTFLIHAVESRLSSVRSPCRRGSCAGEMDRWTSLRSQVCCITCHPDVPGTERKLIIITGLFLKPAELWESVSTSGEVTQCCQQCQMLVTVTVVESKVGCM